jgi:alpha-amylase
VVPTDLAQDRLYHRRGRIHGNAFDSYPENQHGDIFGLKDYDNDDTQEGSELINILITRPTPTGSGRPTSTASGRRHQAHGELASARFCSNIREYALSLGKRSFFLFGELATPDDDVINRYIGRTPRAWIRARRCSSGWTRCSTSAWPKATPAMPRCATY